MTSPALQTIHATVARVSHCIDAKRWEDLRALYADEVDVDYTSLFGGAPQHQKADDLVSGWKKLLGAVTTQHLLGPIEVRLTDSGATAECHVRASHHAQAGEWIVEGHYVFELAACGETWTIHRMVLHTYHQHGSSKVLEPR
ncbi:MAG: hypothetical protein JWN48_3183 [Myxococcaceae bacterium]|nr:hypothetical protein [Myxococcaceae bacterium]